jgi:hypothetical protein
MLRARSLFPLLALALAVALKAEDAAMVTRTFKVPRDFLTANLLAPGETPPPPDPIGLSPPAERPSRPASSKSVLEIQGISFPAGAAAVFNPDTGFLTVTNTRPNLDLVEAFVAAIILKSPATLSHQLVILEGPGELIRQLNAAASRTTNASSELTTLLGYANHPGSNVRVVADAFLEGKSGVRSVTSAVREHIHATGIDLDAKSHATASWDMRPLGVTLEVEPTVSADEITIENNLVIKFCPVTPRIRQLKVTLPDSGQDAEFPFSETAGVEFPTTLVSTAGATRLIGVTTPVGLSDEKTDILWAVFLTSNIRRTQLQTQAPPPQLPAPPGMLAISFHAPPGLLESLMETTPEAASQPLREWLKKEHGISFPTGAVFEQKEDQLLVINTPAMVEAISVLLEHAQSVAPKSIAFTLHTIEAPAAQLRDLIRQSAVAGADDTAVFTNLEASITRGEASFIDSLFLETKSSIRATLDSAREHTFIRRFDLNAQGQPEVIFDMRKVGSLFAVDPYLLADGRTVSLHFSHELHPAPPETRGAHFRDPASGQPFAMPATDFHVLTTSSGIRIMSGGIKLISLSSPTGRDADGRLWASFLKCDVVAQISKPLVAHPAADKTAPVAAPDSWNTKSFRVPPEFLASGLGAPRYTPRMTLEAVGIPFPDGASASYNPSADMMIVRNTNENLAQVAAYVDSILAKPPPTITFTTHILQGPGPLLRRLTAQAASHGNHRAELDELLAAVKSGAIQSLGTNRVETRSGVHSTTPQGVEHTALTETRIDSDNKSEIITENRNVGLTVELEPTIGADGTTIELTPSTEFHTAAPFEHREHIIDTQGRRLESPLTDYFTAKLTTGFSILDGTTRLLSLYKPTGKPEFEKDDILQAIFITCDILRVEN